LLVGSVVIHVKLDRENYNSISRNCDREGLEPLDVRTDPQTRLDGLMDGIIVVKIK
jgi:hypothetical protein